jgi:hypothetical protein
VCVYYCSTYYKLRKWGGGEGEREREREREKFY